MIRVDIETIIMASGPVPSVIVLRERKPSNSSSETPLRALSIQTGPYEAASIGYGIDPNKQVQRPIAHDVLLQSIKGLDAKVERIEINRWEDPVFYADVILARNEPAEAAEDAEGGAAEAAKPAEIKIDARPSDALALATRANAPIYVEDDVMNRAGSVSYQANEQSGTEEFEQFDAFVQNLSPDDF